VRGWRLLKFRMQGNWGYLSLIRTECVDSIG
jgi:hypothetical protein